MMLKKAMIILILCVALSFTLSSTFASAEESEYHQVIVIGAGVAGLTAADHLDKNGYDVVVLEARDRIGGRILTDRAWNGVPLDVRASWIHGVVDNPIAKLAEDNNLETMQYDNFNSIVLYDSEGNLVYRAEEDHYDKDGNLICNESVDYTRYCEINKRFEDFEEFKENQLTNLDKDVPLQYVIDKFLENKTLSEEQMKEFLFTIHWNIEGEWGAYAPDVSAHYESMGYEMEGEEVIFPDGYDQIINILADGLDIRLQHIVTTIEYNDQGVRVITTEGTFEGDYAISTLPLGALKKDSVTFSPPLSASAPDKKKAIDNLDMGILNKVYFIFPEIFWDNDHEWIAHIPEEKGHWTDFMNLARATDKPVLLAFNAGEYGRELEKLPDEKIIAEGMSVLRKIYEKENKIVPEPIYYTITRMASEDFTWGSYSTLVKGASNDDFYELSKPVMNRLLFAGEATEVKYPATVHGAYFSGIREANRIQSFDVILSPVKQMKNWVLPEYVVCREGLELVLSVHDGSAACVSESTKDALVDRGWGQENLY